MTQCRTKRIYFAGVSVRQDSGHWTDELLPAHVQCRAKIFKCGWDRTFILRFAKQEFECQMDKSARVGRNLMCLSAELCWKTDQFWEILEDGTDILFEKVKSPM